MPHIETEAVAQERGYLPLGKRKSMEAAAHFLAGKRLNGADAAVSEVGDNE